LIQSPEYSSNNDYSIILKNYFQTTRYVLKDDVIGVSAREDPLFHLNAKELPNYEWPVLYFRVSLVEGNGCLIDVNNSKLYQTGTIHSLIPATLSSYYSRNNFISVHSSPTPPGLSKYVTLLCDLVFPYLIPKSKTLGTIMINGPLGSGRKTIVKSMCKYWNLHLYEINANDIIGDTAATTETKIKMCLSKASIYSPCVLLISNINLLCNNELYDDPRIAKAFDQVLHELNDFNNEWPIVVIATNLEYKKSANNELSSLFIHSIDIDCPNVEEREIILKGLIGQIAISTDVNLSELAQKTVGFYYGDLFTLVSNALKQLYLSFCDTLEIEVALSGVVLTNKFLINSLSELQHLHSDSIGSPNIPNVQWDDIGGHDHIKAEILDTIQLPYECSQLLNLGFRRSGVLLYGPPGTGKTLLAKAAATQCSLNFLSVKGPELINMYVGQSEENVRDIFNRARKCAPCVIFFDELDSLAPSRGRSGDSGGVMDRVVSQLLAEMDGMNKSNDVFVIGATNRPDLLDSALLRPGRFDRLLYVGIADDSLSRLKILKALTKKFIFDVDMSLEQIESLCPIGLSGADFYSLCSNALINAIERNISEINSNNETNEENCEIKVKFSDFMSALPKNTQISSHENKF
jgi:peroxin-6